MIQNKDIAVVEEQVSKMLTASTTITQIQSQTDYDNAVEFGKKVSKLVKMIDDKEKSITKPINDSLKEIRNLFKPYKTQVEEVKNNIKSAMTAFIQAEEAKRKAEEAKISARVEKGTMREDTAVAKLNAIEENKTDTTGTTTSVLRVEILDIKQIPAEYLTVNETAIKQAYRDGVEVVGVKCWYEKVARL